MNSEEGIGKKFRRLCLRNHPASAVPRHPHNGQGGFGQAADTGRVREVTIIDQLGAKLTPGAPRPPLPGQGVLGGLCPMPWVNGFSGSAALCGNGAGAGAGVPAPTKFPPARQYTSGHPSSSPVPRSRPRCQRSVLRWQTW